MKILSIDVGIKNLAFCLFEMQQTNTNHSLSEPDFRIIQWDIVNLCEEKILLCEYIEKDMTPSSSTSSSCHKTKNKKKNGKTSAAVHKTVDPEVNGPTVCGKPAKFMKKDQCFCLKHAKKTDFLIPTSELKSSFVHKQRIQKLRDMASQYQIHYDFKKTKKEGLISLLDDYIEQTCLEPIHETNASKTDIITIGRNIQTKMDQLFFQPSNTTTMSSSSSSSSEGEKEKSKSENHWIDYVIIENQISPIANKMKTIQGMIAQYFIMKKNTDHIEFISAINKLKDFTGSSLGEEGEEGSVNELHPSSQKGPSQTSKEKMDYGDRKKMGISSCLEYLKAHGSEGQFQEMISYFQKHKKKDDLADCFLQGLWFIKHKL